MHASPSLENQICCTSSLRYILFAGGEMEGVTVGGEFFGFQSFAIELNDGKLSEDVLLPLLEAFRDGKFSRLQSIKLVILIVFNVTKTLLGVTRVLQEGNQIGDRGAEMIGEGLKVNSSLFKLHLVRLRFDFVL
jgi:hypothetical protein